MMIYEYLASCPKCYILVCMDSWWSGGIVYVLEHLTLNAHRLWPVNAPPFQGDFQVQPPEQPANP